MLLPLFANMPLNIIDVEKYIVLLVLTVVLELLLAN